MAEQIGEAPRRVLVTGALFPLATAMLTRLVAEESVAQVVAVDVREPAGLPPGVIFERVDLRTPAMVGILAHRAIDTVVHLAVSASPQQAGGQVRLKERNVIGTMQLMAAVQRSPSVRRVVVKSSTAVYGSAPGDPALFREEATPDVAGRTGYAKDVAEVERYTRGLARRRPDVAVTVLRCANQIGPDAETPLTAYFSLPVLPRVLGYDPRVQLLHSDDAVEVFLRAATQHHPGLFNVAAPGIVYLSQAVRLSGKPTISIPSPFLEGIGEVVRRTGAVDFSRDQLGFLLYGRVGDITRLRYDFGFEPAHTTRQALGDFLASRGLGPQPRKVHP